MGLYTPSEVILMERLYVTDGVVTVMGVITVNDVLVNETSAEINH